MLFLIPDNYARLTAAIERPFFLGGVRMAIVRPNVTYGPGLTMRISADPGPVLSRIKGVQKEIPFATSNALNTVLFAVRDETMRQLPTLLDRPTPWTMRSWYVRKSNKRTLTAQFGLYASRRRGKVPTEVIGQQLAGGRRQPRSTERRLRAAGLLRPGYQLAPAKRNWAVKLNKYGNVAPNLYQQILRAFGLLGGEDGGQAYRANLAKRTEDKDGYVVIGGREYFAIANATHLAAGIWARRGRWGRKIAPVFLATSEPDYEQRVDLQRIADPVVATRWPAEFRAALAKAIASSRYVSAADKARLAAARQ